MVKFCRPVCAGRTIKVDHVRQRLYRLPELSIVSEWRRFLATNLRTEQLSTRQAVFRSKPLSHVHRSFTAAQSAAAAKEINRSNRPDWDRQDLWRRKRCDLAGVCLGDIMHSINVDLLNYLLT